MFKKFQIHALIPMRIIWWWSSNFIFHAMWLMENFFEDCISCQVRTWVGSGFVDADKITGTTTAEGNVVLAMAEEVASEIDAYAFQGLTLEK